VVNICTTCFNIQKLCILLAGCVYVYVMPLVLHNGHFNKAFVRETRCVFSDVGAVFLQLIFMNFRRQTFDFALGILRYVSGSLFLILFLVILFIFHFDYGS
jgi:hypothetical protein